MFNCFLLFNKNGINIATVTDADGGVLHNMSGARYAQWAQYDYHGGLIIASATVSDALLFQSGLDMKYFITEGTPPTL